MKFVSCLAALTLGTATLHGGAINWILEGEPASDGMYWAFLIKTDSALPSADGPALPGDGQIVIGGQPLLQWDTDASQLVLASGAGQIAAIAMLNSYDFCVAYEVNGYGKTGPHPSIEIGETEMGSIDAYNERNFYGFGGPLGAWDPAEGFYYMILFDEDGRYAIAESLQYSANTDNKKVEFDDMTTKPFDNHLDPYFPEGEPEWYALTTTSTVAFDSATMLPLQGKWAQFDQVPEPATASLVLMGLAFLGLRRRARRG